MTVGCPTAGPILVVDDDPTAANALVGLLGRYDRPVHTVGTLSAARALLTLEPRYDLLLFGPALAEASVRELLEELEMLAAERRPGLVLVGHDAADLRRRALDMALKHTKREPSTCSLCWRLRDLQAGADPASPGSRPPCPLPASRFLGSSAAAWRVRGEISVVAPCDGPVFLLGGTGTGKSLVARLIHDSSPRAQHPFVTINCGAVPATLVESELFEHLRGSFTGAEAREGLFETVREGTLFLDEITSLDLSAQGALLHVLQERSFRRIGARRDEPFRGRVIAATNVDPWAQVEGGAFRQDLYFRLNVFPLHLPSLEERLEDLPELIMSLLRRAGREQTVVSPEALDLLRRYPWPGNVRELENVFQRVLAYAGDGQLIKPTDLPHTIRGSSSPAPQVSESSGPLLDEARSAAQTAEARLIREALQRNADNATATAKALGIGRATLYRKIKAYGIDR